MQGSLYRLKWAGLLSDVTDRPEDGLLPLDALGPVMIDFSNRVVVAGARIGAR